MSIKRSIKAGQNVEEWSLKMYDQLEAGVLTDEQVAELEKLIEDYYEKQEQPEPEPEPEGAA